ncbi:MAG: DUF1003 domain-containing protein [Aquamicrobium sp.]|nr:DUF1003 domain-containing protein [Aquamicrobium sp.]
MKQADNTGQTLSCDPNRAGDPPDVSRVLEGNIAALAARRRQEDAQAGFEQRVSRRVTQFAGSMHFVYLHLIFYGFWIVSNLGWTGVEPWDPSMVGLAMIASVEAIFLSTFVLITQNRMSSAAERRAELDLQISMLSEHEITRLMTLLGAIAAKLEVEQAPEEVEVEQDIAPERVMDRIETLNNSTERTS